MKLISARVSNYRIHKDLSVDFRSDLNLIAGENESGKSTLAEAIHRGLFLKGNVTGEALNQMVSHFNAGHPEVEVTFETNGARYTVMKHFSGQSGSTRLTQIGGQTWNSSDAEKQLASLLQVEELSGGRGLKERIIGQWSHLWVWQGNSGNDPSTHAATQNAKLIQQLQQNGGAALQSEKDALVGQAFGQRHAELFTSTGKAKKGSTLDKAQSDVETASKERDRQDERVQSLYQAMQDERDATRQLEESKETEAELATEIQALSKTRKQAEELQRELEKQSDTLKVKTESYQQIFTTNQAIDDLASNIDKATKTLAPKQADRERILIKIDEAKKQSDQAQKALDSASEKSRQARLQKDLSEKFAQKLEADEKSKELNDRTQKTDALQKKIAAYQKEIAKLPPLTSAMVKKLQKLESELREERAALDSMAASIEVIEAANRIQLGDDEISQGTTKTITDTTILSIGNDTRIRIKPGGGDDLSARKASVAQKKDKLNNALEEHGLSSAEKASETLTRIQFKNTEIEKLQAKRETLDADRLPGLIEQATQSLTSLDADIQRRLEQVETFEKPATLDQAKSYREALEETLAQIEKDESEKKRESSANRAALDTLQANFKKQNETLLEEERAQEQSATQLKLLVEQNGDATTRRERLQGLENEKTQAEKAFKQSKKRLSELQPEQIDKDLKRLHRSLENAREQQIAAGNKQAVARNALATDGSENPIAKLEAAEAELEQVQALFARTQLQAESIKLLHELFQSKQQVLSDRFNQPIADKISVYLRFIFGPQARAKVSLADGATQAIELIHSDTGNAIKFDDLSGGAKEQLAAAVRLAIAEVLAADFDGSLPILFDDAFAFSDPKRTQKLQSMLDRAANQGLQVIVLSCTPSDYASLGAKTIELETAHLT